MEKNNSFNKWTSDTEHQNLVLEALRVVNRELIVCAGADIPEIISDAIDAGRDHITRAIRLLKPIDSAGRAPITELSVAEFTRAVERSSWHIRDLLDPLS